MTTVREARQECVNGAWEMAEAQPHIRGAFAAGCERHDKALDAYRAALLAAVRATVEDNEPGCAVPEFHGGIPEELFLAFKQMCVANDRAGIEFIMRDIVKHTKAEVLAALDTIPEDA